MGDVIAVYGDVDYDGFYRGELAGRRGLVPSNFLRPASAADAAPSRPRHPRGPSSPLPPSATMPDDGSMVHGQTGFPAAPPFGGQLPVAFTTAAGPPSAQQQQVRPGDAPQSQQPIIGPPPTQSSAIESRDLAVMSSSPYVAGPPETVDERMRRTGQQAFRR